MKLTPSIFVALAAAAAIQNSNAAECAAELEAWPIARDRITAETKSIVERADLARAWFDEHRAEMTLNEFVKVRGYFEHLGDYRRGWLHLFGAPLVEMPDLLISYLDARAAHLSESDALRLAEIYPERANLIWREMMLARPDLEINPGTLARFTPEGRARFLLEASRRRPELVGHETLSGTTAPARGTGEVGVGSAARDSLLADLRARGPEWPIDRVFEAARQIAEGPQLARLVLDVIDARTRPLAPEEFSFLLKQTEMDAESLLTPTVRQRLVPWSPAGLTAILAHDARHRSRSFRRALWRGLVLESLKPGELSLEQVEAALPIISGRDPGAVASIALYARQSEPEVDARWRLTLHLIEVVLDPSDWNRAVLGRVRLDGATLSPEVFTEVLERLFRPLQSEIDAILAAYRDKHPDRTPPKFLAGTH